MTLKPPVLLMIMAEPTGLEPATSNVTGWRSNQLNYDSARDLGIVISDFGLKSNSMTFQTTEQAKIRNRKFQIDNQNGGHEGTRTPNFLLVREAVYQLTYMPEIPAKLICPTLKNRAASKNGEFVGYEKNVRCVKARTSPIRSATATIRGRRNQNRPLTIGAVIASIAPCCCPPHR